MKTILWAILMVFLIIALAYDTAFANSLLKGGISGSCGNTGLSSLGIVGLLVVLAARRAR